MKWIIQIMAMLFDILLWTVAAILINEEYFITSIIMIILWFKIGGFDAWKSNTRKAFLINFDSYVKTGKPKIRRIK